MKALFIITGVSIGILLGIFPSFAGKKPFWWKMIVIITVTLSISLSLLPPIAGNFSDAYYSAMIGRDKPIKVIFNTNEFSQTYQEKEKQWLLTSNPNESQNQLFLLVLDEKVPAEFQEDNTLIALIKYDKAKNSFIYLSTEYTNPLIVLPYVMDLGERIRILNFHVPMSWIGALAFLMSMIFSIQYLRKRDLNYDIYASASAGLGTLFTVLATVTGMIWAKFNWGAFWNWDPRQTSIFVLLLIYMAYFALRSSLDSEELKARLSSVYSIIAFISVPFLLFVLPRITSGLHPGSGDEANIGPLLSAQSEMLDTTKQIIFSLSFTAFTLLFFWMLNIKIRMKKIIFMQETDL